MAFNTRKPDGHPLCRQAPVVPCALVQGLYMEVVVPGLVDDSALAALRGILGSDSVLTDPAALERYGGDWSSGLPRQPAAIALPSTVEQVQALVRLAVEKGLAVVPSGGRTGLSGGAVAARGELVIALDRLNQIHDFDPIDRTVRCGAGVVTAQLQQFAAAQGLFYPVDFASSGASQIGGNISTNAGGIKVIRYGTTRDWVAGLKLVTGTGELLDLNRGLVKNNAGYDLRHLVIGAEGTLGIVVEATLRLAATPAQLAVVVLAVADLAAALRVLDLARNHYTLSAFEFFSDAALEAVVQRSGLARPMASASPFYVLLEVEQDGQAVPVDTLALYEECSESGLVSDGVLSQSESQAATLWRLRESISEAIAHYSPRKYDISTRVSRMPDCLRDIEVVLRDSCPDFDTVWFGHIGDGNLHLNILKPEAVVPEEFLGRCAVLSEQIFAIVRRYGGSIAAEHGVGLLKKDYLRYSRSDAEIAIMRQIKLAFDPHAIMNPGKIFD